MRFFYAAFSLFVLSILTACSSITHLQSAARPLESTTSFYVVRCADDSQGEKRQVGSGAALTKLVDMALQSQSHSVMVSQRVEGLADALVSAKQRKANYLVLPAILEWKDVATSMADVRDSAKVKIDIYDLREDKLVDSTVIEEQTSWFATQKIPPQDLLAPLINEHINDLFEEPGFWNGLASWVGDAMPGSSSRN